MRVIGRCVMAVCVVVVVVASLKKKLGVGLVGVVCPWAGAPLARCVRVNKSFLPSFLRYQSDALVSAVLARRALDRDDCANRTRSTQCHASPTATCLPPTTPTRS